MCIRDSAKAAKYAGMNVNWITILTMAIAGALAGLAGTIETVSYTHLTLPTSDLV